MFDDVVVRPWALTDLASAKEYMRGSTVEGFVAADVDGLLRQLVNEASGVLEGLTGRRLASRPYTDALTVASCTSTASPSVTLTTTGTFAAVRAGMMVTGTGIAAGTFVVSVQSTTSLTMSASPTTPGTFTATFTGAGRMLLDGTGTEELLVPEWPVTEVISAASLGDSGASTPLTVATARTRAKTVRLPGQAFPEGTMNVSLQCVAGYLDDGFRSERHTLELAALRLVNVMFNDCKDKVGRGTNVTVQGLSLTFLDKGLPADVEAVVNRFRRRA